MRIYDFLTRYDLHDSLITRISLNKNRLIISVDFCYWKQNDYEEESPETGEVVLTFENVFNYSGITGEIDNYSIISVEYYLGTIIFVLCDDYNNAIYTLSFTADSVSISQEEHE